tara:strand:- start:299 stop:460 length:162 start_codon:yes stop_codon:yes gene_type:complete
LPRDKYGTKREYYENNIAVNTGVATIWIVENLAFSNPVPATRNSPFYGEFFYG